MRNIRNISGFYDALSNRQIAKLLEFSDSTLRHDYPSLKPGEQIHPAYVLKLRDNFGKRLTK